MYGGVMKKLIRAILCCLVAINVFMLTAFAAVPSPEVYTSIDQKSNLCDVKTKYSIGRAQSNARRGTFFDSADVIIRDEGNGNIGASAHANLRKPVTELYVSLYLDRYNKEKDVWQQVDYVDFEYTLEQYPDGIEDPSISVTFTNQKRGYYYRIRGAFSAGDDDWYEGFGPTTDGIWIE